MSMNEIRSTVTYTDEIRNISAMPHGVMNDLRYHTYTEEKDTKAKIVSAVAVVALFATVGAFAYMSGTGRTYQVAVAKPAVVASAEVPPPALPDALPELAPPEAAILPPPAPMEIPAQQTASVEKKVPAQIRPKIETAAPVEAAPPARLAQSAPIAAPEIATIAPSAPVVEAAPEPAPAPEASIAPPVEAPVEAAPAQPAEAAPAAEPAPATP